MSGWQGTNEESPERHEGETASDGKDIRGEADDWAKDLHKEYKSWCGPKPPKTGDICYDLKREIEYFEQCVQLRQAWDDSFFPGRHNDHIQQDLRSLKKLKRRLKNSTCEDKDC